MSTRVPETATTVTTGPIPRAAPSTISTSTGLRVPQRRVHPTNGEHLDLYDTSGPHTDDTAVIDLDAGSAPRWVSNPRQRSWRRHRRDGVHAAREGLAPELVRARLHAAAR